MNSWAKEDQEILERFYSIKDPHKWNATYRLKQRWLEGSRQKLELYYFNYFNQNGRSPDNATIEAWLQENCGWQYTTSVQRNKK